MMNMTTDFTVEFGGDSHEIDLNTLITSLVNFGAAIQEIQSEIAPEAKVDIKVRAPQQGSFLIDILLSAPDAVAQTMKLFTRENVSLVENILSVFANSINLKGHLKGEQPKAITHSEDGMTVSIENTQGNIIIMNQPVFNLYNKNPKIDALISKGFAAIEKDTAVESVKIKNKKGDTIANVEEADFEVMGLPGLATDPALKRTISKENINIRAFRLSFEENVKWGFVYEGEKIQATISDPEFQKLIEDNEPFAKGDVLKVNLSINQEFDKSVQDYLNKTYEVTKLVQHIRANRQGKLFDNE